MIQPVSITAKQTLLLSAAQAAVDRAQTDLNIVAQTVLAGLSIEGQLVSVDTVKNVVNIEDGKTEA